MYTRRSFLKTVGALGAAYALPSFAADPFSLGVASGYPSPDGVVLWTRLAGTLDPLAVPVRWEIADDEAFKSVLFSGTTAAEPTWAHSVHVEVSGLALYAEEPNALLNSSHAGRSATKKGVEHPAARWNNQRKQPTHQRDRLDRGMRIAATA